eukprot:g7908.t1
MSPLLVILFVYYIFMGSASILVVKFSESGGGKLVYNVAAAVFFIEFFKLVAAVFLDRLGLCGSTPDSRRTTSFVSWLRYEYAGPALMYAVQNNLGFYAISLLGPPLFSLFVNAKILFAALSGAVLLRQHFTSVQWLALVNLVLALVVSKIHTLGGDCGVVSSAAGGGGGGAKGGRVGGGRMLLEGVFDGAGEERSIETANVVQNGEKTTFTSDHDRGLTGLSGAVNEWLLKAVDADVPLMRKNAWTYQWGMVFNLAALVLLEPGKLLDPVSLFFQGFNGGVWAIIAVNVLLGLSVSLVLKYFDNIIKCIGGVIIIFTTTFASYVFFETEICAEFVVAVLIFGVASLLYVGGHNNVLKDHALGNFYTGAAGGGQGQLSPQVRSSKKILDEEEGGAEMVGIISRDGDEDDLDEAGSLQTVTKY